MTPYERRLFERAQRRASALWPDLLRAVLQAFQALRESLNEAEMSRLIDSGQLDRLIDEVFSAETVDRSTIPLRTQIRRATEQSFRFHTADLPKGGKVEGTIAVMFDTLSPKVIEAIRSIEIQIGKTYTDSTKEVVRAFVENGLRDGWGPRKVAKGIREVVGLAPNQQQDVWRYREKLQHAHEGGEITNTLRDKRFDATVRKAQETGQAIPASKVEKMVAAYSDARKAQHAETIARTAALQANKQAQRLSWEAAVEAGVVDRDKLHRVWVGVMDERERDSHREMEGDTVALDEPHRNGQMVPGEGEYNCRCIDRFVVASA